jgi:hypothetical protein
VEQLSDKDHDVFQEYEQTHTCVQWPKPVKGQESPETKVSTPMVTRSQASRAGSLRSGGGSGQTDTCVAKATLPKPES